MDDRRPLTTCPDCGAELHVVKRRSPGQRAWAWFNCGPDPWRIRVACDACGFEATDRSMTMLARPRRLGSARQRWRRFQLSRRYDPVPRFYAILAAGGAIVGVVLQQTVGWSWWWTAFAAPAAGWAWAATSAVRR